MSPCRETWPATNGPEAASLRPIVVGGLGGSGTRVVAEVLQAAGVYIGSVLNSSLDDQCFNYLFKHPRIYSSPAALSAAGNLGGSSLLALHRRLYFGHGPEGWSQWRPWLRAGLMHAVERYGPLWVLGLWRRMFAMHPTSASVWGLKEPHSMYFLADLSKAYPGAYFVLVVRDGFDMAFSSNTQQFYNWGATVDLDPSDTSRRNMFEFWYRSNLKVLELGPRLFGPRFLSLSFEDVCDSPTEEISRLLSRLQLGDRFTQDLVSIPKSPPSRGRHLNRDAAWIDSRVLAQRDKIRRLVVKRQGTPSNHLTLPGDETLL